MPSDSISQSLPVAGIESLRPLLMGTRHMAVAGHYGAAHAAFAVLEAGGNAVDAGVAAGIALGVLQSDLVNVAGVAPIMIYRADRARRIDDQRPRHLAARRDAGFFPEAPRRQDSGGHSAHRRSGRARRLDHGAGELRHDELRRLRRGGDPLRERRASRCTG